MRSPVPSSFAYALALAIAFAGALVLGEDAPRSVEDVARASRPSVVVISSSGRAGDVRGAGTGFIAAPGGIVVTNLHVIGEGRAFTIQLADGAKVKATGIVAFDRVKDLAVISIDRTDLPALELGDSDALRPGQTVLAVGNPLGLGLSVTSGTVAQAKSEETGRRLIQVAMPIEPGSSGSPLIDLAGKVAGVIFMKPAGNTAIAVPVNDVKALLASPRRMPIERWLTIGALDPKQWRPALGGGEWRQRAGRIVASGAGDGFGGRMICLSESPLPDGDFDLSVETRLEDESGAAGLAFHSDGGDRHYGFYPTAGSLRLTRFEGPDVFSWTILETVSSAHYRPGEWNEIRVRLRGAKLTCLVNGEVAIETEDGKLPRGKAGLVKFREPGAEFRHFRVAPELPPPVKAPEEAVSKTLDLVSKLARGEAKESEVIDALLPLGESGSRALESRAASLEKEAARVRSLAAQSRARSIERELLQILGAKEDDIDLLRAALLLAKLDNADLEIEPYVTVAERMGREARERLEGKATPDEKLAALVEYVFGDLGFRGSEAEYYHRSNSYLNEVLDDREGIPITLSVVLLEVARRAGLSMVGIGAPGHFLVEYRPDGGERRLVDAFGGGRTITRKQAEELSGAPLEESQFAPATKRQIIVRMLRNLLGAAQRDRDADGMLRYLDAIVRLDDVPDAEGIDRWMRAVVRFQTGRRDGAVEDLEWLAGRDVPGVERARVEELLEAARQRRE